MAKQLKWEYVEGNYIYGEYTEGPDYLIGYLDKDNAWHYYDVPIPIPGKGTANPFGNAESAPRKFRSDWNQRQYDAYQKRNNEVQSRNGRSPDFATLLHQQNQKILGGADFFLRYTQQLSSSPTKDITSLLSFLSNTSPQSSTPKVLQTDVLGQSFQQRNFSQSNQYGSSINNLSEEIVEDAQSQNKEKNNCNNCQILYFGKNDGNDKIELSFVRNLNLNDNTIAIVNHGNEYELWDRSGNYSSGYDFKINSPELLHYYLYEYSPQYKNSFDNKKHIAVLLYYCNSNKFAERLSEINPYITVVGADGFWIFSSSGEVLGVTDSRGKYGNMIWIYKKGIINAGYKSMDMYMNHFHKK